MSFLKIVFLSFIADLSIKNNILWEDIDHNYGVDFEVLKSISYIA
tara:strand:- start:654 stop:788 length:135 start_codon:yes stop_codon:yes gene_type:complete